MGFACLLAKPGILLGRWGLPQGLSSLWLAIFRQPYFSGLQDHLYPAPTPTVSSNGTANGIVWAVNTANNKTNGPAILRAYDAANVSRQLFDSSTNTANQAGPAVKFVVSTVADGRVYVGTQSELDVYGILP